MIPGATPIKVFFLNLGEFKAWRTKMITYKRPHTRTQAGRHSAHTYTHAYNHTRCAHTHTHTFAHAFSARRREHIAGSSALLIKVW